MYHIKLRVGFSPHFEHKDTYQFTFKDIPSFKDEFLKRFGNVVGSNRVMKDKPTVKKRTQMIQTIPDIVTWQQLVNSESHWTIQIVYLYESKPHSNNRTEIYSIKNQ